MVRKNRKYYQNLSDEALEAEFQKVPTIKKSRVISGMLREYEEVAAETKHQQIVLQHFARTRPQGFGF